MKHVIESSKVKFELLVQGSYPSDSYVELITDLLTNYLVHKCPRHEELENFIKMLNVPDYDTFISNLRQNRNSINFPYLFPYTRDEKMPNFIILRSIVYLSWIKILDSEGLLDNDKNYSGRVK
jgi:hypothetical protein